MKTNSTCVIWGTPARKMPKTRGGEYRDSPRAGGKYFISRRAVIELKKYDERSKAHLTTWLVKQRKLGNSCPEIYPLTVKDLKQMGNTSVSERSDNILKFLAEKSDVPGTQVRYRIKHNLSQTVQLNDLDKTYLEFLAYSECLSEDDLVFLLKYLNDIEMIEHIGVNMIRQACILTVQGYARLAELEKTHVVSSRAFVAMWFDDSMTEVWENGFKPAIREAGYEPVRIDKQEHVNKIDDEIIAEIRKARFVVADFTQGSDGARGGVYYEAGFAHGLDIPVIFTCREDLLEKLHFDTRQYPHILWTKPEELYVALKNRITSVLGEGQSVQLPRKH